MHRHTASSGSDGARLRLASFTEDEPMSEELSEDGYRAEPEAVFEGPAAWTDVDQEEVCPCCSELTAPSPGSLSSLHNMTERWHTGVYIRSELAQQCAHRRSSMHAFVESPPTLACEARLLSNSHLAAVQLERVAVNVSRSAMPSSSDNSELANRLAMQAAALEADNMDPLGLGRIDTQVLGLVSASSGRHLCSVGLLMRLTRIGVGTRSSALW